jgi:hypothetical protein
MACEGIGNGVEHVQPVAGTDTLPVYDAYVVVGTCPAELA